MSKRPSGLIPFRLAAPSASLGRSVPSLPFASHPFRRGYSETMVAKYFVPKRHGGKKRAHIWLGRETACRLSSTGGLNPRRYMVADSPGSREICAMCQTNAAKRMPQFQAANAKRVVWGDTWEDFFELANKHLGF